MKKWFIKGSFIVAAYLLAFNLSAADAPTLAVQFPFEMDPNGRISDNVKREMDLVGDIPQAYIDAIKSRGIFKDVLRNTKNEPVKAEYFLKGMITEVHTGNGVARHFAGMYGGGLSNIKINLQLLDKDGKEIKKTLINQRGAKMDIKGAWSNKDNIMTAVKASTRQVIIFLNSSGSQMTNGDPKGEIIRGLQSHTADGIRTAAKKIDALGHYGTVEIMAEVKATLEWYAVNPDENEYLIDGISWCCIVSGKSRNKDLLPVLLPLAKDKKFDSKIRKHAKKAVKELGGTLE